jgi:hypothetical protein
VEFNSSINFKTAPGKAGSEVAYWDGGEYWWWF